MSYLALKHSIVVGYVCGLAWLTGQGAAEGLIRSRRCTRSHTDNHPNLHQLEHVTKGAFEGVLRAHFTPVFILGKGMARFGGLACGKDVCIQESNIDFHEIHK